MPSDWSIPQMTDQDFYTGYGWAVINKRANRSVTLGKNFLFTNASDSIIEGANAKGTKVTHPYLDIMRSSTDFSERDFWYNISTYLDLEGVYYLMAVRTVTANGTVGNIQSFTLLNPYCVKPICDRMGTLGGYIEQQNNMQREIPKEMIIPIKLLNPFDPTKPYSLADAARDSQFTLKQSNDYARESINGNLNAPGIISSGIELPDDQFDNFVERIKHHGRGEPVFGNGVGTVNWVDMQVDLDKAALDDINTISRDALLAVSGTSKTGMGIEETGTGREVSLTQKDDFTENAVMPQIENIIDALNLDYRIYYNKAWTTNNYQIALDNPLSTDRAAEQLDVTIRTTEFTLMQMLIDEGYDIDIASKYAKGLISITDIGEPTNDPKPDPTLTPPQPDQTPEGDGEDPNQPEPDNDDIDPSGDPKNNYEGKQFDVYEGYPIPLKQYLMDYAPQLNSISEKGSFVYSTESILQMNAAKKTVTISKIDAIGNSLIGIVDDTTFIKLGEFNNNADKIAIVSILNKRYKNQPVAIKKKIDLNDNDNVYEIIKNAAPFDKQAAIGQNTANLQQSAQSAEEAVYQWYVNQLSAGVTSPHLPSQQLQAFIDSLTVPFAVYFTVLFPTYAQARIQETSKKYDLPDTLPIVTITPQIKQMIQDFAQNEATSHINTIKTDIENALAMIKARTSDPAEIKTQLAAAFKQIQAERSLTIANNAASRIFNISQYEADAQFLTKAGKIDQAYKVLFSLTGDPCPICESIIESTNASPIPFTQAFVNLGDTIEAGGRKMTFNFEEITAGNVHPNCHCAYQLILNSTDASSS